MKSHLLWDYAGRFAGTIIQFIISVILTRLLSPSDYGLVGIAMAINGIASIFINLGFSSYIIQTEKPSKETLSSIFWLNIFLGLVLYIGISASSSSVATFYNIPELKGILFWTALTLIINLTGSVSAALLMKNMRFKEINIRNVFIAILSGILGIIMAYRGFGVWALVAQSIVSAALTLVANFLLAKWQPILFFSIESLRHSFKFGIFLFLSGLMEGIYSRLDVFLIGKVFQTQELGYYTRAQSLDGMIRNLSSGSLLSVLFPAFAQIKTDDKKVKELYFTYFELISFVFCLMAGFFYIAAVPLYTLLFGSRWYTSAIYFQLLILAGFAYPLSSLMLTILEARGNSKVFFRVEVLKKILFFPTYVIAYFFGIAWYLKSFLVACVIGTGLNLIFLNKEIHVGYVQSFRILSKYLLTGLVLGIFLYAVLPAQGTLIGASFGCFILVSFYITFHYFTHSPALQMILKQFNKAK